MLVDNGYPDYLVSRVAKRVIDRWYSKAASTPAEGPPPIKIYYKSHMSSSYKTDERILKNIITRNVKPTDNTQRLDLIIYYRSKRTSHLLLKNNCTPPPSLLQRSHVIYKSECQHENCGPCGTYIGMTSTKLSRRLTCHLQNGAIKAHMLSRHNSPLTREHLEKGTSVLASETDHRRLAILEAVYIKMLTPSMNIQNEALLSLPSARNPSHPPAPGGASTSFRTQHQVRPAYV